MFAGVPELDLGVMSLQLRDFMPGNGKEVQGEESIIVAHDSGGFPCCCSGIFKNQCQQAGEPPNYLGIV